MGQTKLPEFFHCDDYFIDEKVGLLKFANAYKVFNQDGQQIGNIRQVVPLWHKFLRLLLDKRMFPFTLNIADANEQVVASIHRGWTFWMSKIEIRDMNGVVVGGIKQKFKFMKPLFHILDANGAVLAEIKGDWKAWNFQIVDSADRELGAISKKWAGAFKEVFTTADKYRVTIAKECPEDVNKMAIVAGAITIDMVLKESK
ncbi:scramblase [Chitinophaga filiformis]|uniref:phospholipid scramblase-related protein n=1 Tax=Chitinophaga filiformis TaxID=104663 RepID=UPI001F32C4AD|nr:phospholipid scramblase-related protein [Chitinophaga filiformis]MCF6407616.1 scramblase [Chitinophaga filiformis]MCF6407679.1 scramblase [Chitinophaga filiformis]